MQLSRPQHLLGDNLWGEISSLCVRGGWGSEQLIKVKLDPGDKCSNLGGIAFSCSSRILTPDLEENGSFCLQDELCFTRQIHQSQTVRYIVMYLLVL